MYSEIEGWGLASIVSPICWFVNQSNIVALDFISSFCFPLMEFRVASNSP